MRDFELDFYYILDQDQIETLIREKYDLNDKDKVEFVFSTEDNKLKILIGP